MRSTEPAQSHAAGAYRSEIDGLRAVAVLAVVLYHFGLPGLGGGFVGVDIFFVISGFLIGGILWTEWRHTQRIELASFFLRRVRRLAPAFFAMTAVTTLCAYLVLLPFEFREFGKSLIAATVWLSNVQFFRESGYFDIGADNKVLLHTWSLSVEEQFYVALPLTLLLLRRSKRAMLWVLCGAWGASLVACIALTPWAPTATFFLFPFRAWELLTGVLLAIWGQETRATWRYGPIWSWLGLLLLLGSIALIRPGTHFPGAWALAPVLGAALVLLNGRDPNTVNRMLSARAPTFIGLISYSLYLWHWPVLTLSTYWRGGYGSAWEAAAWLLLAVLLSVAAWAVVERPVRRSASNRGLLIGFVAAVLLSIGAGLWAYLSDGAKQRFSPLAQVHIEASNGFFVDFSRCAVATSGSLQGLDVCTVGPPGTPQVLFWGDSHLRAMMQGIGQAAMETRTPALIVWHAGCPPLFGVAKAESAATPAQDQKCLADTETLRRALPQMEDIRRLVLVGRWSYYAQGAGSGLDAHNRITLSAAPGAAPLAPDSAGLYAAAWERTVGELQPHVDQIFVWRQVPEMPRYASRDVARRLVHGRMQQQDLAALATATDEEVSTRMALADAPLRRLAEQGRIRLIDPWPDLCKPACSVVHDGRSYYFDNNHVSNAGALALRARLVPALTGRNAP
jgi:peptidoglycan/LPS O-acetylase OafA/YrhL